MGFIVKIPRRKPLTPAQVETLRGALQNQASLRISTDRQRESYITRSPTHQERMCDPEKNGPAMKKPMTRRLRPSFCCLLSLPLILASLLWPQQAPGLSISVLAGEGATNSIDKRQTVSPLVQVLDARGEPVSGAEVRFSAPVTGPSVTFFGAATSTTVLTDPEGRAQVSGMLPNTYEGPFSIEVAANYQGESATAVINQTNAVAEVRAKKKRLLGWRAIGGIAAAVAIGIIAAVNSSDD